MAAEPLRVMIVDDHALVRSGVASLLAEYDDIEVVSSAADAAEALERCGELDTDVVLMDLSMPDIDGATATGWLLDRYPNVRVVILTAFVDPSAVRAAVRAGATAGLLKSVSHDELAQAIRDVTRGRSTFSSELLPHITAQPDSDLVGSNLTSREHDILTLLANGKTNKAIARTLDLSDGTVRIYVSAILAKLGVANRTEATVVAIRQGLVAKDC